MSRTCDMPEGYRLHSASARDVLDVQQMAEASHDGPGWPRQAWQSYATPAADGLQKGELLVLRDGDGRLAGWAAGTVLDQTAELEYLMVAPGRRARGLGRLLLQAWLTWAREQGCREVQLELRASNDRAWRLYRSAGFVEQGRRPQYYRDPVEDAVLLCFRAAMGTVEG